MRAIKEAVVKQCRSKFKYVSIYDENIIMQGLPPSLATKIISLRHEDAISIIRPFHYIPNRSIVIHIFQKMVPHFYETGHFLIKEGEPAKRIYFLITGVAQILVMIRSSRRRHAEKNKYVSVQSRRRGTMMKQRARSINLSVARPGTELYSQRGVDLGTKRGGMLPPPQKILSEFELVEEIKRGDFVGHKAMLQCRPQPMSVRAAAPCSAYALSDAEITKLTDNSNAIHINLKYALSAAISEQSNRFGKLLARKSRARFLKEIKYRFQAKKRPNEASYGKQMLPAAGKNEVGRQWSSGGLTSILNFGSNDSPKAVSDTAKSASILGDVTLRMRSMNKLPLRRKGNFVTPILEDMEEKEGTVSAPGPSEVTQAGGTNLPLRNGAVTNEIHAARIDSSDTLPEKNLLASLGSNLDDGGEIRRPQVVRTSSLTAKSLKSSKWDVVRTAVLRSRFPDAPGNLPLRRKWDQLVKATVSPSASKSSVSKLIFANSSKSESRLSDIVRAMVKKPQRAYLLQNESVYFYDSEDDVQVGPLAAIKRESLSIARRNSSSALENVSNHVVRGSKMRRTFSFPSLDIQIWKRRKRRSPYL